jgi:acyl dehydratase
MKDVDTAADLVPLVGQEMGVSEWFTVDQKMIDAFAELTGDRQWIHVDVERAKKEMPGGKTIAHGYLLIGLMPRVVIYRIMRRSRTLNIGIDRLRFTGMVPSGSRIRQRLSIKAVERIEGGYRVTNQCTVELEGKDKPALVFDQVLQYYDPA